MLDLLILFFIIIRNYKWSSLILYHSQTLLLLFICLIQYSWFHITHFWLFIKYLNHWRLYSNRSLSHNSLKIYNILKLFCYIPIITYLSIHWSGKVKFHERWRCVCYKILKSWFVYRHNLTCRVRHLGWYIISTCHWTSL